MLSNIKIIIEYNGRRFCGWQSQKMGTCRAKRKKRFSVQETIETCLKKILKEKICLLSSGRTDSGVHALRQVAHFKTHSKLSPQKMQFALNGNLPKDIRIIGADYVGLNFHSRYAAKYKTYRYIILNQGFTSAIFKDYCYLVKFPLNINSMKRAARFLIGKHDFKAFCSTGSAVRGTVRTIRRISINTPRNIFLNDVSKHKFVCIEIEADGFLYNMVRNIVGTLIEVGRGKISSKSIASILKSKKRDLCGPCVPAKGLYLCGVQY